MGKRFTDTSKWQKAWFRQLSPKLKCAWEFLRDNCDLAGVWDIDMDSMKFHVGETVTQDEILKAFETRVRLINDNKLLLTQFIEFQYGELSEDCKPHKAVLNRLSKLNLLKDYLKSRERVKSTLTENSERVLQTLQEKEKEKDKVKDQEKEKDQERVTSLGFQKETRTLPLSVPIAKAVNKYGNPNGEAARKELGEEIWGKIKEVGGWSRVCKMEPKELSFTFK